MTKNKKSTKKESEVVKMEYMHLNDKLVKKALGNENKYIRNYVARLISHITNIPLELLKDHLELVYPEISANSNIVNSISDLTFQNDFCYFNIEINYHMDKTTRNKGLAYVFQLSLRQLKNHKEYRNLKPVTLININSKDTFGKGDLLYEAEIMVKKYNIPYTEDVKIYEINLSYFKTIDYTIIKEEGLLKDLALFTTNDEKFLNNLYKEDRDVNMLREELDSLAKTFDEMLYCSPEELQRQIDDEKYERGFEEGELKGKNEEKLEIAKSLLNNGLDPEFVAQNTGLTLEEIQSLQKEIKTKE